MIKSTSVLDAFTERNSKHPRPDHFPSSLKPEMCLLYPTGHWNNNNFNINSNSLKNYLLCDLSSLSLLLFGVTDYWVHCSPGASSNRILCLPCRISPSQTIGGGVLACLLDPEMLVGRHSRLTDSQTAWSLAAFLYTLMALSWLVADPNNLRKHWIKPGLLSSYADCCTYPGAACWVSPERAVRRMSRHSKHEEFLSCFYNTLWIAWATRKWCS